VIPDGYVRTADVVLALSYRVDVPSTTIATGYPLDSASSARP
jgi:hypothetical protein